jgi:hypothetical protein
MVRDHLVINKVDNNNADLKQIEYEDIDWVYRVQDKIQW